MNRVASIMLNGYRARMRGLDFPVDEPTQVEPPADPHAFLIEAAACGLWLLNHGLWRTAREVLISSLEHCHEPQDALWTRMSVTVELLNRGQHELARQTLMANDRFALRLMYREEAA